MKKMTCLFVMCILNTISIYSQPEPISIEGIAQGTSYHITYFDKKNRDLQPQIDKILNVLFFVLV